MNYISGASALYLSAEGNFKLFRVIAVKGTGTMRICFQSYNLFMVSNQLFNSFMISWELLRPGTRLRDTMYNISGILNSLAQRMADKLGPPI